MGKVSKVSFRRGQVKAWEKIEKGLRKKRKSKEREILLPPS